MTSPESHLVTDRPDLEIVPMAAGTASDINTTIHKTLEENGIDSCAYQKYIKRKYGNTSLNICWWHNHCIPPRRDEISSQQLFTKEVIQNLNKNHKYPFKSVPTRRSTQQETLMKKPKTAYVAPHILRIHKDIKCSTTNQGTTKEHLTIWRNIQHY